MISLLKRMATLPVAAWSHVFRARTPQTRAEVMLQDIENAIFEAEMEAMDRTFVVAYLKNKQEWLRQRTVPSAPPPHATLHQIKP